MNPTSARFRRRCATALAALPLALAPGATAATAGHHHPAKRPVRPLAPHRRPTARLAPAHPRPRPAPRPGAAGAAALAAAGSAHARVALRRPAVRPAVAHAHMAGDPAVSIVDFSFSPGTTTIHVGDTITWTNTGQQPHSATADNHSFDTGILHHGQSGSHTFNAAGTFTYICIVHPNMHGTVVVLAASTTTTTQPTTSTPTATAGTTPTTASTPTSTAGQLPLTGSDELPAVALGFGLVGAGFLLRQRARRPVTPDGDDS